MIKDFRYPLMIGILLAFFNQYTGAASVTFYSNEIFKNAGANNPTTYTFIVNFA